VRLLTINFSYNQSGVAHQISGPRLHVSVLSLHWFQAHLMGQINVRNAGFEPFEELRYLGKPSRRSRRHLMQREGVDPARIA
jgi:hypothetical protein